MSKLSKVNVLRAKVKLPPIEKIPVNDAYGISRCEHCLSIVSDHELDIERCASCDKRIDVRISPSEWDEMMEIETP